MKEKFRSIFQDQCYTVTESITCISVPGTMGGYLIQRFVVR